jgi:hypothetical protein
LLRPRQNPKIPRSQVRTRLVAPLKCLPVGYGFHFPGLLVGPIVNGLWGLGTAVILNGRLSIDPLLR